MYYSQEIIDQVIDATDIVDVISEYVSLTKRGSTYFGLCPFHNEKTPSFSVTNNGDRKMFYCFGCHTGGTVITFLMKYESLSYPEALKTLAKRAGIALPEPRYSPEAEAKNRLREQILQVYKDSAVYFYHLLNSSRGDQARAYLQKRELSEQTIRNFGLGYSDKYRDDLYRYIKNKGYSDEILKETGLFSIKETDIHDYFWNRVMFPIMDPSNRVIAFGGRVMGEGEPKYLNSPETMVFEKRRTLYGLHIAKKHKGEELILCEGYMDVISLHQAGFSNAVASLGTALTSGHAGILKRYTSGVVLSYDSDGAGRNAAVRAIPILREAGLRVRVINLSPYKDPDELIKAEGADSYRERLKNARNGILFEIDVLQEAADMNDPDSRTRFVQDTARRLSRIEDEIERETYLHTVSEEFQIDYKLLKDRTIRLALSGEDAKRYEAAQETREREQNGRNRREKRSAEKESERILLSYLAEKPSFYAKIRDLIKADDFKTPVYHAVAEAMFAQLQNGRLNLSGIVGSLEEESDQEQAAELFQHSALLEDEQLQQKLINECVIHIVRNALEEQSARESDILKVVELRKKQESLKNLNVFQ